MFFLVFQRFTHELFENNSQQALLSFYLICEDTERNLVYFFIFLLLPEKKEKYLDNKEYTNKTFETTHHSILIKSLHFPRVL